MDWNTVIVNMEVKLEKGLNGALRRTLSHIAKLDNPVHSPKVKKIKTPDKDGNWYFKIGHRYRAYFDLDRTTHTIKVNRVCDRGKSFKR